MSSTTDQSEIPFWARFNKSSHDFEIAFEKFHGMSVKQYEDLSNKGLIGKQEERLQPDIHGSEDNSEEMSYVSAQDDLGTPEPEHFQQEEVDNGDKDDLGTPEPEHFQEEEVDNGDKDAEANGSPQEAPKPMSWRQKMVRSISLRDSAKSLVSEQECPDNEYKGFKRFFGRRKSSVSRSRTTVVDGDSEEEEEAVDNSDHIRKPPFWRRLSMASSNSQYQAVSTADVDFVEEAREIVVEDAKPGNWRRFKKKMSRVFRPGRYASASDTVAAN